MWHRSPTKPGSQTQVVLFIVSQQRPLSHEVALHWAVGGEKGGSVWDTPSQALAESGKLPSGLTFVANGKF